MKKSFLLASLCAALCACASGSAVTETPVPSEKTVEKRSVTVAVYSQFTGMDPATSTDLINAYVFNHMYASMFRKDAQGQVVNDLCRSYEISEDGLTYTFQIRDDAVWSDGTPLTSGDFVYTFLRNLSYGADTAQRVYDMVTFVEGAAEYQAAALEKGNEWDCTKEDHSYVGFEAPDDHTLVVKLKMPCNYLTTSMTNQGWIPMHPSTSQHDSLWAMEPGHPTSHGYVMTEMNPNDKCVLKKSETFYDADSITMDEIVWQVITDMESQNLAFKAGEIDVATSISSDVAAGYLGQEELWVAEVPNSYCLIINTGEKGPEWAKDVRVRKALAMAVDQKAVADVIGGETFYPILRSFVPFGSEGVDQDFRTERDEEGNYNLYYDPEEAVRLLKEAGYDEDSPLSIEYYYSTNSMHTDVATCLQQMWGAVGVDVTFKAVESGVYYEGWNNGDYEIARYGAVVNHPVTTLDTFTSTYQRVPTVADEEYDKMVARIKVTVDPKEALRLSHEAEDYLVDEQVHLIPMFQFTLPMLKDPSLRDTENHGSYIYFGYSHFE